MEDGALIELDISDEIEDLEGGRNWAEGAVLWSTDWTAETIVAQLGKGNINLNPNFQRRSAWRNEKQSLFIESVILGIPIPQLILAEDKNKKGAFIVIDGKQRLLALRRFAADDKDEDFDPLQLKALEVLSHLNGKKYSDLEKNIEFSDHLTAFQNSSIRTIVIRNWQSEAYLYEVFLRINTGSVQLSPQELRQALHPGPFSTYVDSASGDSEELKRALNLNRPDFRMRDAEILLRFLAYQNFSETYVGNLKQFLDLTTKRLNQDWDEKSRSIRDQVDQMEKALEFTRQTFGEDQYLRKWNGRHFEGRKNRAVFDIMLHFFARPDVRDRLQNKRVDLVDSFKRLCTVDDQFLASIERTTKSIDANRIRFNRWRQEVARIAEMQIAEMNFG